MGTTDLYGTHYEDNFVATGLGAHMALPLLRKHWKEGLTEEEARKLLVDCMRVLFYRDTRASAKITIGKVRPRAHAALFRHPFQSPNVTRRSSTTRRRHTFFAPAAAAASPTFRRSI